MNPSPHLPKVESTVWSPAAVATIPIPVQILEARYMDVLRSSSSPEPHLLPDSVAAPPSWRMPATSTESTIHQLAPYIGKLKSTIARDLIEQYSRLGDLLIDPFSGAGTIPLEAVLLGRRVFACDISPYAATLTLAKLTPPSSLAAALSQAEDLVAMAEAMGEIDLGTVPTWVCRFFHPRTLSSAMAFARVCKDTGSHFHLACLLGILHHQRPGFLSYPSSHLVPYLRDRKFPRSQYPELYEHRELRPRLLAKIKRALKRYSTPPNVVADFREATFQPSLLPDTFDCLVTSPPYMNALDYGRDNRLRLWFLDQTAAASVDGMMQDPRRAFIHLMISLADTLEARLRNGGYAVFIVGDSVKRTTAAHPAKAILAIMRDRAPSVHWENTIIDTIPDIRRARRECQGVKQEQILVYRRPV